MKNDPLQGADRQIMEGDHIGDWAEIRHLYLAEQMTIKAIARRLGL